MKYLNIIAEGYSEEIFVNTVLKDYFAQLNIWVSVRKIKTGWDKENDKPAKGGLLKYIKLKNDILNWIESDNKKANTWYTSFIDLYAFPKDSESPYTLDIQKINNPYQKVQALEKAIEKNIAHPNFIPYVQLHEFEALLLVEPDRLIEMFPDAEKKVSKLKADIGNKKPEEINESPHTAPSKRIIKYIPEYKNQKAQLAPMIAGEIGITALRNQCQHFDEWIIKLESI